MIWPDWQYPHCGTSWSIQAFWILAPASVAPIPSIVVMEELPMLSVEVMQDRVERPVRIGRGLADFEKVVAPQTVNA